MIAEQRLPRRIVEALARDGIEAIVIVEPNRVRLEGLIGSPELRDAATDIAFEIAPSALIDNQLEVIPILPLPELPADEPEREQLESALRTLGEEAVQQIEEKQRLASSDLEDWPRDPGSAEPVFAPTDPIVKTGRHGLEILGGFADTSVDEVAAEEHDVSGVVRLTAAVSSLDDADAAEEVAGRVPGVVEVDERLEIGSSPS
jgi:osmotically-inducible protein OsmY